MRKWVSILSRDFAPRLVRWGLPGLWFLWLLGQVFRDATALTEFLFYIPSLVVFVVFLCGGGYAFWTKQRVVAIVLAVLAIAPAGVVLCVENRWRAADSRSEHTFRLVHWNVFRGRLGWDGIQEALRKRAPDICVLAEVPRRADIDAAAASFGEGWRGVRMRSLAVFARGELRDGAWLQRRDGIEAYGIVWETERGPCRVLVIDLDPHLHLARGPRLRRVCELMVEWRADIVVGDFNAPRRSHALCPLPSGFVHAYDAAGAGYSATWPLPCPVYAIDQCIAGTRIAPVRYALESSWRSDHRRQIFDFTMREMRIGSR